MSDGWKAALLILKSLGGFIGIFLIFILISEEPSQDKIYTNNKETNTQVQQIDCSDTYSKIKKSFYTSSFYTDSTFIPLVNQYFDNCKSVDENGNDKYFYLSWFYFMRGENAFKNNDWSNAITNLNKTVALNDKSVKKRPLFTEISWIGISYYHLGKFIEAKKYLEYEYINSKHHTLPTLETLADTYYKLEEFGNAAQFYNYALNFLYDLQQNMKDNAWLNPIKQEDVDFFNLKESYYKTRLEELKFQNTY